MTDYKLDNRAKKWIKEGRGKGSGKDYRPWLTVRDLPSQGRSHRVMGHLTQRTHHFLSDLELATFLLLEWNSTVSDIREQFPLHVEDTLRLAEEANIRHPEIGGYTQVMSTDFVVDFSASSGARRMAIQVKSSSDLKDSRTIEKLELERRYWQQKGISWCLVTEKQIPGTVVKNLETLYAARVQIDSLDSLFNGLPIYLDFLGAHPNTKLPEIAMLVDQSYSLEPGATLSRLRALMALRALTFDISIPWSQLVAADLQVVEDIALLRASHAANQ